MKMADIFVFPSLSEGLGVSLVEAAGLGCTCITTGLPPMTEVIDHAESGLCVPPKDADALASAMVALAQHPERAAAFGQEAARRAKLRFDRKVVTDAIERVYLSVLDPKAGAVSTLG
jgi:glycosyltransferase involved in cell wall biosynthesis